MPQVVRTVAEMRAVVRMWHRDGHKVAVVPTMGALHEGHLTLVREGFKHAAKVIVTIFVNPKQFAAHEDLGKYPRTEEADLALLAAEHADLVFAPSPVEMYAAGFATSIHMQGPAVAGLEDTFRPHFFDGVATVVAKLFIQSQADFAMFGEKDFQQLLTVRQLAADLDIPITVIAVPTVRDADGMAKSSRNRYLSAAERQRATAIVQTLRLAADQIRGGIEPHDACTAAVKHLTDSGYKVDYVAARNALTLAVPNVSGEPLRLLAAAWLGTTRLIDNIAV